VGLILPKELLARLGFAHGETDLAVPAPAYAYGITKNHLLVDGDKRADFAALIMFPWLNDIALIVEPAQATLAIPGVASGEISENGLARWIRDNPPNARPVRDIQAKT
jgi:death on curing protein